MCGVNKLMLHELGSGYHTVAIQYTPQQASAIDNGFLACYEEGRKVCSLSSKQSFPVIPAISHHLIPLSACTDVANQQTNSKHR